MLETVPWPAAKHAQRLGVVGGGSFIDKNLIVSLRAQVHEVQRLCRTDRVDGPLDALVYAQGGRSPAFEGLHEEHVGTTARLLESVRPSSAFYLSSGQYYGARVVPFRGDSPLAGSSPYTLEKLRSEALVPGFPGTHAHVLRLAILLPPLINRLSRGEDVELAGFEQSRDFVDADDVAPLVAACIERPSAGTFNCGSGVETEVRPVALEVERRFDALGPGRVLFPALGEWVSAVVNR